MRAEDVLRAVHEEYWHGYDEFVIQTHLKRLSFEYGLCKALVPDAKTMCDIGGGWGAFAALCSKMGFDATLVDDFGDYGCNDKSDPRWYLPEAYGVQVLRQNVLAEDFFLEPKKYDVITCFDCLEHLHNSPKKFLHCVVAALKPGGLMLIGVPNCVNLMKRVRVIAGTHSWSELQEWYENPVFRGHVREPSVSDLYQIARDLDLEEATVFGYNWLGRQKDSLIVRLLARLFDSLLRLRPSLCSDLYLTGFKGK
ncbi:MAG: class I SAM-dependent methyltransferase [Desulfomonilaceae bacterium]